MLSPTPSSLALGGSITLPQLAHLTGMQQSDARLLAEKYAGPARSRRHGRHLVLYWPLPALADYLGGRSIPGILPGGWCTLAFVDAQLRDLPAAQRRRIITGGLLRRRPGCSRAGTRCSTYALADLLAILRNNPSTLTT